MKRAEAALVQKAKEALERSLGPSLVKQDADTLAAYGRDESDTGEFPADLVVFCERTEHVQEVFRACQTLGVPVTPVAARSGKSGGSLPLYGGVSMSLERMRRIKRLAVEDLIIVVEPGVITGDIHKAVEAQGLFYPPDPNSWEFCSIGGNVAENAGGPRALKYGVTRDYVLGLEWVLPSGEVVRVGRQTIKGVAGYDLVGLFVGSEGTLGVATEITLQLIPLPKRVRTALIVFPSVLHAARAVSAVLAAGILPRTLELLDDVSLRAVDGRGGVSFPKGASAAVLAEVDGNVDEALLGELSSVGEICEREGALETLVAQTEEQRDKLWAARRTLSTALRALKPFKISEDIAVPRSRIAEVIERLKALGQELGLTVATYGHAGDGNLHANILFDGPGDRAKVDEAVARMLRLTVEVGGTITGEHGVGYAKRDFLGLEQGPSLIELQRSVKRLLDPKGLLNPGKIFPER
ncbi:MAG: FAD-binding oxidoreductase [Myxococcota bacterium]